jgi:hypothetical protein
MPDLFRGYSNGIAITIEAGETHMLFAAKRPMLKPDGRVDTVVEEIANITMSYEFSKVVLEKLSVQINTIEAAKAMRNPAEDKGSNIVSIPKKDK